MILFLLVLVQIVNGIHLPNLHKIDLNSRNVNGYTPLHLAIMNGKSSAVQMLLTNGAMTNVTDYKRRVPLDLAIANDNTAIIKMLKASGAKSTPEIELYQWKGKSDGKPTVIGGYDRNCNGLYVGRTWFKGNLLPSKVCEGRAYFTINGEEHSLDQYEVLESERIAWKPVNNNFEISSDLIKGAKTKEGKQLYFGRGIITVNGEGLWTPGKIDPSNGLLYTSYAGKEYSLAVYEVLVVY